MKNVMTKLMIAAAAFVAVAGTASAQTLEAKIPFAFRASSKVFTAGTYSVQMTRTATAGQMLIISNPDGKHDLLTLAYPSGEAKRAWRSTGDAVLSFQCGVSRCILTDIWTGAGPVYHLPTPGLGKDENVRAAEIVMHLVKAD
jgi:hypothetical protein